MDEKSDSSDETASEVSGGNQVKTAPVLPGSRVAPAKQTINVIHHDYEAMPEDADMPETEPEAEAAETETVPSEEIPTATKKRRRLHLGKKGLIILLFVLLNVGIGGATGYLKYVRKPAAASTVATTQSTTKTTTSNKAKVTGVDANTLHYVSKSLGLEFDYPVDWRITASSDNTTIRMSSAPFKFTDPDGKLTNDTIDISISPVSAGDYFDGVYDTDKTQAPSEVLIYKKPTASQRTSTYISFSNYDTTASGSIGTVWISGSNNYAKGDTVSSKNYKSVDPRVSLTVDQCASGQCVQALINDTFTIDDWHTDANFLKAKTVLESLRLN